MVDLHEKISNGKMKGVEQTIKLLTIVLSIYEFDVGEFPGRARIN